MCSFRSVGDRAPVFPLHFNNHECKWRQSISWLYSPSDNAAADLSQNW
jgi:hypothetical protein